jgi:2-dehydro-3-deoxyphosphogluconate aldolase/(4S)-4-hydroxy-2-oxoglutarate aldolase
MKIEETLFQLGIIPVVTIENPEDGPRTAKALIEGGLPLMEVTLRTKHALNALEKIASETPEIILGAGTINSVADAKSSLQAGAQFLVSPGFNPSVAEYCLANNIPLFPGVITPSEIEIAIGYGFTTLKLFPAEAAGGLNWLKAISAPYPELRFIPTGGINLNNLNQYLAHPSVLACGGSWLAEKSLISTQKYDEITARTKKATANMLGFKLQHTGIHFKEYQDAYQASQKFMHLINGDQIAIGNSIMVDGMVEFMSGNRFAEKGHVALGTNSIPRAERYFSEQKNIQVLDGSSILDENNEKVAVYLDIQFEGFGVHLVKNR